MFSRSVFSLHFWKFFKCWYKPRTLTVCEFAFKWRLLWAISFFFFLFLFFFLYKCESTVKNVPLHKKVNCFYDCIRTTRIKWLSFKRTSALCWQFAVAYGQWKVKVLDTLFPFFSDQIPSLSVPFCFHFDTHSWNSVKFSCCGEVWGISVKISCSWNQAHSFSMAEMSS